MQKRLTSALEPIGICPPHYGILIILNEKPDYNQLKLGEELGFDKATMVKLIDELEKKDFLNRITHSTDRRQKLIVMTEKGRKSLEKAKKISKSLEEKLMSYITKEEEVILKKVIPELLEQLSEEANKQKIDF